VRNKAQQFSVTQIPVEWFQQKGLDPGCEKKNHGRIGCVLEVFQAAATVGGFKLLVVV